MKNILWKIRYFLKKKMNKDTFLCSHCEYPDDKYKGYCDNKPCGPGCPVKCDCCGQTYDWWCGDPYEK